MEPGVTINTRSNTRIAATSTVNTTIAVTGPGLGSRHRASRNVAPPEESSPARNSTTMKPSQDQANADASTHQMRSGPSHVTPRPNNAVISPRPGAGAKTSRNPPPDTTADTPNATISTYSRTRHSFPTCRLSTATQ